MRRLAAIVAAAILVCWSSPVDAGVGDTGDNTPSTDEDGRVTVEVNGIQFTNGSGPACRWTRLTQGQMERRLGTPPVYVEPDPLPDLDPLPTDREPTDEEIEAYENAEDERNEEVDRRDRARAAEKARTDRPSSIQLEQNGELTEHGMFSAFCAGRDINADLIAINTPPPVLQEALRDKVVGQIDPPVSNINPPLEAGGVVNLGMWLAITPQAPLGQLTAEIPGSWVTAYPAHDSVTFHFGDGGEPVSCSGAGTPIPVSALNEVDPSPTCGYVYRQSSFDDAPYQLSIDTTWVIPYESSTGSGALDPFTRRATFDYDVDEIQTLGTS